MSTTCLLDYDSIAGADKFGNIFVLRVPSDISDDIDNPTGTPPSLIGFYPPVFPVVVKW